MGARQSLSDILTRARVVDPIRLHRITQQMRASEDLSDLLVQRGIIDEDTLLGVISSALNVSTVRLDSIKPKPEALAQVSAETCTAYLALPLAVEQGPTGRQVLQVAMANPTREDALKALIRSARMPIQPLVASARSIRQALLQHFDDATSDTDAHETISSPDALSRTSPPMEALPPLPDIPARVVERTSDGALPPPVMTPLPLMGLPPTPPSEVHSPPPELAAPVLTQVNDASLQGLIDALDRRLMATPESAVSVLRVLIHRMIAEGQLSEESLQAMLDAPT
ncbi:MAG: hypothetical protein ACE366_02695 [Bradymonadia bacterium]